MGKTKSTPRFPHLNKQVLLAQTDTTVGFLSQNKKKLDGIKGRPPNKPYLINIFDLKTAKELVRIPNNRKREIRRSKKTTYIVKNQAFRVAQFPSSSAFFRQLQWCYSTSANESGKSFDESFTKKYADIIIENQLGLFETTPSRLIKLNAKKKKRLR